MTTFRTEFSLHLRYAKGLGAFREGKSCPLCRHWARIFLNDVLGEFKLEHVAWHSGTAMFLCQATVDRMYWSLAEAKRALSKRNGKSCQRRGHDDCLLWRYGTKG